MNTSATRASVASMLLLVPSWKYWAFGPMAYARPRPLKALGPRRHIVPLLLLHRVHHPSSGGLRRGYRGRMVTFRQEMTYFSKTLPSLAPRHSVLRPMAVPALRTRDRRIPQAQSVCTSNLPGRSRQRRVGCRGRCKCTAALHTLGTASPQGRVLCALMAEAATVMSRITVQHTHRTSRKISLQSRKHSLFQGKAW